MGLGLLGRGIGDAKFLASCGAKVLVTDLKSQQDLAPALAELQGVQGIDYVLGEHREEDFIHTDMVMYAAGVRKDSPYLAAARQKGVPVYMSTALFAKFAKEVGATLVGVTGTRGKTTVAHMIHHCTVGSILGGNIRGQSTLALLPTIKSGDVVVLELDSWQLQGFGTLHLSPDIAVFTNLMPDHLNYYANMDEYFDDKANIFKFQKEQKVIAGAQIAHKIPGAIIPMPRKWNLKLLGEHNQENASLAAGALRLLGIGEEEIIKGLESFEGVEGRLQFVRKVRGVKIYNDNNATTPEATLAALKSFKDPVILIAGGADKRLPLESLAIEAEKCKKVLLLAGNGSDLLVAALRNRVRYDILIYQTISQALHDALESAEGGDVILFSPGFASFGMFKNEYDRNDQFMKAVTELT